MITIRRTTALAVLLAGASAVSLSVASAGSNATKQCVSFVGSFDVGKGSGSWKLIPLSPGPLKPDSGKLKGDGSLGEKLVMNGQRVTPIIGSDSMTGKRGTLVINQNIDSTDVGGGFTADVGTWTIISGTGAYKGVKGGGRFAAASRDGTVHSNQEGCFTTR